MTHIPFNMTGANGTGFTLFARLANSYTDELFWFTMLITLIVIIFFLLLNFGVRVAGGVASFLGFLMGLMLRTMELITQQQLIGLIILAALSFLYLAFTSRTA